MHHQKLFNKNSNLQLDPFWCPTLNMIEVRY